jgi:hypothetical protein
MRWLLLFRRAEQRRYRQSRRSGCDWNEVLIQEFDNFRIGERTRPQAKGPASTSAGIDLPVVSEQEDGPVCFGGHLFGGEYAGRPSDLVETLLSAGGLDLADLRFNSGDEMIVLDPGFGSAD